MYPVLYSLGELKIYSYPLFMGLAWGLAYQISFYLIQKLEITFKNFALFCVGLFVVAWIGAKVLFLLVSVNSNHVDYIVSSNFWMGGGFVFYGGLIFGLLYLFLYSKFIDKKIGLNELIVLVPALSFAHALGRIGCLLTGCCYGRATDSYFSVYIRGAYRYPVQLYEAVGLTLLGIVLIVFVLKKYKPVNIIYTYLMSYSLIRFVLEFIRGDKIRGVYWAGLSTSQIISLIIFFVSLTYLLIALIKRETNE